MNLKTLILVAGALALPLSGPAAQTLKQDAGDAWDATKNAAVKTGDVVENGAAKTGHVIEHGAAKAGSIVERGAMKTGDVVVRGLAPVTSRIRGTPRVTMNDDRIMAPNRVFAGSDLIVRNSGDTAERFSIKGSGLREHVFVKPGQVRRLDLDLPRGEYTISSSEGGVSMLRVR